MARAGISIEGYRDDLAGEIKRRTLSQRAAAREIGISESLLSKILNGATTRISKESFDLLINFPTPQPKLGGARGDELPLFPIDSGSALQRTREPRSRQATRDGADRIVWPPTDRRRCLVIGALGCDDSKERRSFVGLVATVRRALKGFGYDVKGAHEIAMQGRITDQIKELLREVDLVVADLTGTNANVMYEYGMRDQVGRDTILVMTCGTQLPFDVKDQRSISFTNDILGSHELEAELARTIGDMNPRGRRRRRDPRGVVRIARDRRATR